MLEEKRPFSALKNEDDGEIIKLGAQVSKMAFDPSAEDPCNLETIPPRGLVFTHPEDQEKHFSKRLENMFFNHPDVPPHLKEMMRQEQKEVATILSTQHLRASPPHLNHYAQIDHAHSIDQAQQIVPTLYPALPPLSPVSQSSSNPFVNIPVITTSAIHSYTPPTTTSAFKTPFCPPTFSHSVPSTQCQSSGNHNFMLQPFRSLPPPNDQIKSILSSDGPKDITDALKRFKDTITFLPSFDPSSSKFLEYSQWVLYCKATYAPFWNEHVLVIALAGKLLNAARETWIKNFQKLGPNWIWTLDAFLELMKKHHGDQTPAVVAQHNLSSMTMTPVEVQNGYYRQYFNRIFEKTKVAFPNKHEEVHVSQALTTFRNTIEPESIRTEVIFHDDPNVDNILNLAELLFNKLKYKDQQNKSITINHVGDCSPDPPNEEHINGVLGSRPKARNFRPQHGYNQRPTQHQRSGRFQNRPSYYQNRNVGPRFQQQYGQRSYNQYDNNQWSNQGRPFMATVYKCTNCHNLHEISQQCPHPASKNGPFRSSSH